MNEVPQTEHTEANDHPPAPGQPPTGRPPDPGHGNQASTTVVHQSESKVGATNGVEASPGRLETFLDDKTTKKWSRIIAIGFVLGACVLAAWDGWDEALRVAQNAGRMTLAGGLATVAVVLFVVSRTGSTLRGSTTPILAVTAYAVAAWFLLALPDEGHPTGWNVDTRVIAFACLSVGFLLASAAMLKHESLERAFSVDTSVGSTVLMLWTAIVVYAIALFAGIALTEGSDFALDCQAAESRRCIDPAAWPDYLILLGVPGAAAAFAKADKSDDVAVSTSTRSTNEITEVQYFVFNVIAMLIVLGGLWRDGRLGEVPDALLGLTSVSALTFVLVKRVPPSGTPVDP